MSLIQAQMILGERKVEDAAYLTEDVGEIIFQTDNIVINLNAFYISEYAIGIRPTLP